jgi:hypothetical protein
VGRCHWVHILLVIGPVQRLDLSQYLLPPTGITLHSVFGQSQTFQILTKYIGKTINNYETKYMQYKNIFYDNSNNGYFIL